MQYWTNRAWNDKSRIGRTQKLSDSEYSQTLRDRQYLFAMAVIRYNREALCTKLNTWDTKILQIKFVKAVNSL